MLLIQTAQMETFEAAAMRAFEDRTYEHLCEYFPRHCLLLGEEQVRQVIRLGWHKAKSYDLTAECCVRSFIEFMCIMGSGFDKDPLMPWAKRILNDKESYGEIERGDRLYDQAWEYITYISQDYRDAAGNPATTRFVNEINNLRNGSNKVVTGSGFQNFASVLAWRLQAVFPAKCHYVGDKRIYNLIIDATKSAITYGIKTEHGVTLFTVYMFVLGSGFAHDPLLPWASATLNDKEISSQTDRVNRLYAEGVGFLKRWWKSAPEQES